VQEGMNSTEAILELETGSDVLISCLNIKGIRRTTNIVDKEMGHYFIATFKMEKDYHYNRECTHVPENKHKFVQKDAKVEVLDIIMSLIVQSCAELGEKS
jgi:hypothetical protein